MNPFLFFVFSSLSIMSVSSIIIVGLNGALQKQFILSRESSLVPGDVHRAVDIKTGIGGKGQDVAISLSCLKYPDFQLAQFVGNGNEGNLVLSLLKDRLGESTATALTIRTESQMRTCTTIVAADMSTELVEPSGIITMKERDDLLDNLKKESVKDTTTAAALCIMGSMPPGLPDDMYASIYRNVASPKTLCLIDSVKGLEPLISALNSNKQGLLKINASELSRMMGVRKSSSEAGGIKLKELEEAVQTFKEKYTNARQGLSGIALTDGKHPSYLISFDDNDEGYEIIQIRVPVLDKAVSIYPIGAGDSVAAGTLACWKTLTSIENNDDGGLNENILAAITRRRMKKDMEYRSEQTRILEIAFAFGLACGSASCLNEENSTFRIDDVISLLDEMPPPQLISSNNAS